MKLKYVIGSAGAALCVAAWVALGVGFALKVDIVVWTVLVTAAAIATELMFWCLAVTLGLTVVQARKKIWLALTGRFRGRKDQAKAAQD
jgi:hypothetical protein